MMQEPRWYLLGPDGEPVGPVDFETYCTSAQADPESRRVALDELDDGTRVSTVFLGLDHQFSDGPPLLFETMAFPAGSWMDEICYRTSSRAAALAAHDGAVAEMQTRIRQFVAEMKDKGA